jgi:hypothetical protein
MAISIRFYYIPDPLVDSTNIQVGEVFRPKASIRMSFAHGIITNELECSGGFWCRQKFISFKVR